jgi:hypothetical protein
MSKRALLLLPLIAITGCAAPSPALPPHFGGAAEHNLHTMLADPFDLVDQRDQPSRLSSRRDAVFQHYARGEDTSARRTNAESASVSGVGKADH